MYFETSWEVVDGAVSRISDNLIHWLTLCLLNTFNYVYYIPIGILEIFIIIIMFIWTRSFSKQLVPLKKKNRDPLRNSQGLSREQYL